MLKYDALCDVTKQVTEKMKLNESQIPISFILKLVWSIIGYPDAGGSKYGYLFNYYYISVDSVLSSNTFSLI